MDRRSIIAAVDGSPEATNAAHAAGALARALGRRLVLASVAEDPAVFPYGDRRERELQRRRVTEEANEILERVVADVGVPTRKRLALSGPLHGSVAERLNSLVREEDADLIVLGSSARGPLRRLFGSVTAELRRIGEAPVLVVPRDATDVTWEPGGTVVLGVDGSADSDRAQFVASGVAERLGLSVVPVFIDEAALSPVPVMIVPPHAEFPDLRPSERLAGSAA